MSVIIVNYNSGEHLSKVIGGLEKQIFREFDVVIVDNASNDGSVEAVKECSLDVTYLRLSKNVGFAAANNRAINICSGTYVALLNPDAFPEPGWLGELVRCADVNPAIAAFGSRQMIFGENGMLDGTGDIYHCSGKVWRRRYGARMSAADLVPTVIFSPCAAAALYRKAVFNDVGGFDEDFFCYLEDVDLGFRLRLMGYSALYVPSAVVHHVGSATTGGRRSDFSIYHGHRNLEWVYVKNMPGILLWGFLPIHLAYSLFSMIYFLLLGYPSSIFRAKKDALRGFCKMLEKRKKIQPRRSIAVVRLFRAIDKRFWPSDRRA